MKALQDQIGLYKRVQVVLGIVAAATAIAFYFAAYRPATKCLQTFDLQIHSKQRDLEQNRNKARNLDILARELQKLEQQAAAYDRQFPGQAELGQFIRDITQISQQLSLAEWKYEPLPPKRGDNYFEVPVIMHFQGDFMNVATFLRQIEDMQRLTRIKKLEIRGRDRDRGSVQVEMAMSIYYSEG